MHVVAGAGMAALGARAAVKDIYSPSGVFRPTEHSQALRTEFGRYQGDVEEGNRAAQVYKQSLQTALPKDLRSCSPLQIHQFWRIAREAD